MGEEDVQKLKWEGKSTAEVRSLTADEVWPLLADDYCSLHKLLPGVLDSCSWVEGSPGQPGLTRRCANTSTSRWAEERLIAIDTEEMWFTYEVTANNVGLQSYQATIRVSPSVEEGGCKIEWSFVSEPAEGWKMEDLNSYIESCVQAVALNIEVALKPQGTAC
ncbi:hypothetical protein SAY87_009685 [Trapa incisa]|uniref:Lachrymatory factor synthase n=1 Tax=Trapa incisa TaxID=236973 RepID=A0AAN7PYD7_9MYRT|nr:hypothetical protein SAY87_009685 [Trapa incisa]